MYRVNKGPFAPAGSFCECRIIFASVGCGNGMERPLSEGRPM